MIWMQPPGLWCLSVSRVIFLKRASLMEHETGTGSLQKFSSTSTEKSSHRALLRLLQVRSRSMGEFENKSSDLIRIGKWSDLRVRIGYQLLQALCGLWLPRYRRRSRALLLGLWWIDID